MPQLPGDANTTVCSGSAEDTAPSDADFHITVQRPLCRLKLLIARAAGSQAEASIDIVRSLKITMEDSLAIEAATRAQRDSSAWFLHRRGRITASVFKDVCRSKQIKCTTLANKILGTKQVNSPAIRYGIDNERLAKERAFDAFKAQHKDARIEDCGLMISPEYPHLGCSPDAVLYCSCHSAPVLLEVKCMFGLRDVDPTKLLVEGQKKSDFCLNAAGMLKSTHRYFYQVQAQIHLNLVGSTQCYLYLHVDKGGALVLVQKDESFMDTHADTLNSFFCNVIVPRL